MKAIIEGLLFASGDDGISIKQLAKIVEMPNSTVKHLLEELSFDYEHLERGIKIMEDNGMYHLTTKPEHSRFLKKWADTTTSSKLSQAAMETLAIIAYEQPITRTEIEEIRGVNSDRPVKTLLSRSLIEEVGRREGIGRPVLFGTTKEFLTYFGLSSLKELPPLTNSMQSEDDVQKEIDLFFGKHNA